MRRVRVGEFDEFAAAELPRLLGLARALTGNDHDAWDLVQESLARVGARWHRLEAVHDVGAYTRTVLVRLNIDRLRRRRREVTTAEPADVPVLPDQRDGVEPWLATALLTLSPRQRTAVVLRYGLDLDADQIAAQMRCSAGTVRSHLSRGLERLRQSAPASTATGGRPLTDEEVDR